MPHATTAVDELAPLLEEAATLVSRYGEMDLFCGYDTGAEFAAELRSLALRVAYRDGNARLPLLVIFAPTGAWDDGVGKEGMDLANRICALVQALEGSR